LLTSQERAQVEAIMRRLADRQAAIQRDPNLSPEGKRALRAREQLNAEQAHRQLIDASDARHKQALRDTYYKTFGLKEASANDVIADRDARQFASGLTSPGEAFKALAAAELRGDVSLARAIAERAWTERGTDVDGQWDGVLRSYAEGNPVRNKNLGALAELTDDSRSDRFYRNLVRPEDLQRGSIEQLAAQADQLTTTGA
jgi:hypothetical protein